MATALVLFIILKNLLRYALIDERVMPITMRLLLRSFQCKRKRNTENHAFASEGGHFTVCQNDFFILVCLKFKQQYNLSTNWHRNKLDLKAVKKLKNFFFKH